MNLPPHIVTALEARNIVVVIGKPRMGKTRYALDIAASFTLDARPIPVLLLAPGSNRKALLRRLKATWKPARLRAAPLFVDTAPRLWPVQMWFRAWQVDRTLRRRGARLGLIIVDDFHCIGGRSHAQRLSDCKILAREMGLPVIVLARPHPSLTAALRQERVASITLPPRAKPSPSSCSPDETPTNIRLRSQEINDIEQGDCQ